MYQENSSDQVKSTQPESHGYPYLRIEDPKKFGLKPVRTICSYCQSRITTSIQNVEGALTYLLVAGLCAIGCVCGCCLLPFYWTQCKDVIHSCPECGADVGRYNRLCPN